VPTDDEQLVAALRQGDAQAFATLVDRHSPAMLRIALAHVPTRAAAEEAVQETWIAVLRGIDSFEGRAHPGQAPQGSSVALKVTPASPWVAPRFGARAPGSAPRTAGHLGAPARSPSPRATRMTGTLNRSSQTAARTTPSSSNGTMI
jgi:hypothetical protein